MTTAFVLSGGASLGAVQVGMLQALTEHGVAPDLLVVVMTELLTGAEVALCAVDVLHAILARCAIPGLFPAVLHDGQTLVDGGLADNTAISQAVLAGPRPVTGSPQVSRVLSQNRRGRPWAL